MANSTVHVVAHSQAALREYPAAKRSSTVASVLRQLQNEFAAAGSIEGAGELGTTAGGIQIAFLSRAVVLQAIGAALIVGLWIAGVAGKPFEGNAARSAGSSSAWDYWVSAACSLIAHD